jgi:cold shock CspA family protein
MRAFRARLPVLAVLGVGVIAAAACSPLGALDGVVLGPGDRHSVMDGQVRSVDLRRSRVEIRDQWNRGQTLRVDRSTRVVYRQRDYPISALERGDVVRVRVARDRNGTVWADRIDVRESVRDRGGSHGRAERLTGTVDHVDSRRGFFTISPGRNQTLVVYVPSRVSRDDERRFQRLRRGDRVRVEVVPVGRGTAELVRFR